MLIGGWVLRLVVCWLSGSLLFFAGLRLIEGLGSAVMGLRMGLGLVELTSGLVGLVELTFGLVVLGLVGSGLAVGLVVGMEIDSGWLVGQIR